MTADPAVRLTAPAKLTFELRITGVRPDGYHLIDAEMATLDLHDVVTVAATSHERESGVTVTGPYAAGVPTDDANLVVRALGLADRRARVTLDKRIPHGGGLGGGSSDAAAVLRWAGWPTDPAGLAAAATIGADVPFCLVGGRARVRGIGELVDALPHVDRTVTVVVPPLAVSTPAAYRAWDALGGPTADGPNDLEPAAIAVVPELAHWRDLIGDACGATPVLAGSGATWFVLGDHAAALVAVAAAGAHVVTSHTVTTPTGRPA